MFEITIPWPISVNHSYFRSANGRMYKDPKIEGYRQKVWALLKQAAAPKFSGRLAVMIEAYPPDKRRRDLDNVLKGSLDALQHGGLYGDDNQIDWLGIERKEITKGGKLIVRVKEI